MYFVLQIIEASFRKYFLEMSKKSFMLEHDKFNNNNNLYLYHLQEIIKKIKLILFTYQMKT